MTRLFVLAPFLLVACGVADGAPLPGIEPVDPAPPTEAPAQQREPSDSGASRSIVIRSGAQATLGNVRIAAGNIWETEYTPRGKAPRKGLTAQLWVHVGGEPRTHRRVYPGEEFTAGGRTFTVVSVEPGAVQLATPREAK